MHQIVVKYKNECRIINKRMSNPPFGDFASWSRIAEILFAQNRRALVALALTCRTFRAQFLHEGLLLTWAGHNPEHIKYLAKRWCVPYSRNVIISMIMSRQTNGRNHQHYCYNCGVEALRFIDADSNPLCPAICCDCDNKQRKTWIQCGCIARRQMLHDGFIRRKILYDKNCDLCVDFITNGDRSELRTAGAVVERIAQLRFLRKYIDYFAVENLAQALIKRRGYLPRSSKWMQSVCEQILRLALPGNIYPDVFPWENEGRRCIWNAHPDYSFSAQRLADILAKPHDYLLRRISI